MKTILFTAAFAMIIGTASAQKVKSAEVPEAVKAKLSSLYPNAQEIEWEKEDAGFEAEFEINEVETSANFDAAGNFLESETEIKTSELPKTVIEYMTGKKIKEASKITDAAGKITYEAESGKKDYIFDSEGKFIKTVDVD